MANQNVSPNLSSNAQEEFDIIIIGAGPAGLSMARSAALLGLKIAIIEKQSNEAIENPQYDGREIALTHRSMNIMSELGMWDKIPIKEISKIQSARVFNGNEDFFMGLSSKDTKQLSYIIANDKIRKAAIEIVKSDENIKIFASETIETLNITHRDCNIKTQSGLVIKAKLLMAADSRFSNIRDMVGLPASKFNFEKTMIVCRMKHQKPHDYIANECFHIGHTMAILPLNDNCCSMVLTFKPEEAKKIMALSDTEFNQWVMDNYQNKLGKMELISARYPYPLIGVYSDKFVSKRFALMGDAAVGMHPVTAHGFNFGLMGVELMTNALKNALRRNIDIGSDTILRGFEINHQRATLPLYLGTAAIVNLYTNDNFAAQIARKALIRIADKMSPIKSIIMDKLMDDSNKSPLPLPRLLALLKLLKN